MTDIRFDYDGAVAATAAAMLAKAKDDESFARALAAVGVVVKGMQSWGGLLPHNPSYELRDYFVAEGRGGSYHLSAFGRDVFNKLDFGPATMAESENAEVAEGENAEVAEDGNADGAGADADATEGDKPAEA